MEPGAPPIKPPTTRASCAHAACSMIPVVPIVTFLQLCGGGGGGGDQRKKNDRGSLRGKKMFSHNNKPVGRPLVVIMPVRWKELVVLRKATDRQTVGESVSPFLIPRHSVCLQHVCTTCILTGGLLQIKVPTYYVPVGTVCVYTLRRVRTTTESRQ